MIYHYSKFLIYSAIIAFFIHDLWVDYSNQETNLHFYLELLFVVLVGWLLFHQFYTLKKIQLELLSVTKTVKNLQGEMANYINQTFDKWQLTNAEHDIAWLIIKGYSFKEIAHIRKVSGKTISQQTSIIYKKSNVSNRHELMSNFLEEFINFK